MNNDEHITCDNCGYPTETEPYRDGPSARYHHFCRICASTFLSRATTDPDCLSQGDIWMLRSLGYIANAILEIIGEEFEISTAPEDVAKK